MSKITVAEPVTAAECTSGVQILSRTGYAEVVEVLQARIRAGEDAARRLLEFKRKFRDYHCPDCKAFVLDGGPRCGACSERQQVFRDHDAREYFAENQHWLWP